ncbi:MAG TPA: WYL domain-containing protein [Polyangiaceae bacterium]|nr:WYL domain-containing protein [Polyangiaceae bacterium]
MPRNAAPRSAHDRLIRQYQILAALSQSRQGLTAMQIKATTGISRSTFQRDLDILRSAGIPIDCTDGRYHFLRARELPPLGLSALQIASLHLARAQLAPVGGTLLLRELDRFLSTLEDPRGKAKPQQTAFHFADSRKPAPVPQVARAIEKALTSKHRVRIEYRAASRGGASTCVHIEPLVVNVAESDAYVRAYCVERQSERTYKLSRIASAEVTRDRFTRGLTSPGDEPFPHAVKAWSGSPRTIQLRLDAGVAWLAREHPLPGQQQHVEPDGSVIVRATVAGLVEAQRRILAWGSAAEVLEPAELRRAMQSELAAALRKYEGPGPAKGHDEKSTGAGRVSLKQGGKKAG